MMFPFKVYNLVFKEIFKCEQSIIYQILKLLTKTSFINIQHFNHLNIHAPNLCENTFPKLRDKIIYISIKKT